MQFQRVCFALVLLLVGASSVGAVVDPAQDRIGLYFDTEASQTALIAEPFVPFSIYIIVTNPTFPSLYGWETAVWGLPSSYSMVNISLSGGGMNSAIAPEFAVAYDSPLPMEAATVLVDIQVLSASIDIVCLALTGISDSAIPGELPLIWKNPGQPEPIERSQMFENGVVASVNDGPYIDLPPHCAGVVASVNTSWGSTKSLYR